MADAFTANLNLCKPEVGASGDTWGDKTNSNWDIVDGHLGTGGGTGGTGGTFLPLAGGMLTGNLSVQNGATPIAAGNMVIGYTGSLPAVAFDSTRSLAIGSGGNFQFYSAGASMMDVDVPTGNVGLKGNLYVANTRNQWFGTDTTNSNSPSLYFNASHCMYVGPAGGFNLAYPSAGSPLFTVDQGGNLSITGQGSKPGGGSWAATSDARVKITLGPYTRGLADVLRLRPTRYRYRATLPGNTHVGLIAQEVEDQWPELVTRTAGEIDGRRVADLRVLDPSDLIYALVNAVAELAAEMAALKAARG
jgi:hypothetical protein